MTLSLGEVLQDIWGLPMNRDFQLDIGDICGDPTGLRVKVEDVDVYDYVYFSVINGSREHEAQLGDMSHVAFSHRFTRLGNGFETLYRNLPSQPLILANGPSLLSGWTGSRR